MSHDAAAVSARATDQVRALRAALRALCDRHGLPLLLRARLVLSATLLARPAAEAGQPVDFSGDVRPDASGNSALLVVTARVPAGGPRPHDLPLPAEDAGGGCVVWRIPLPAVPRQEHRLAPAQPDDERATEQELRAVLAHSDTVEREHRQLKQELAETNSGVLAMYVDLEERDQRLRRAHAVIFRELEDALRPPPPDVPGVELAVHYAPAGGDAPTGGDLYDWFLLPDGTLHITVVDAVGHGVVCTRKALTVTHTVRTLALEGHPLEDLVRRTALTLGPTNPGLMATVLLARLDPATGVLRLANGSHPPALLVGAGGATTYLAAPGRGVGFPEPGSAAVLTRQLRPGELLLLYTDGLVECRQDIDEGEVRLASLAAEHAALSTDVVPATVVRQMQDLVLHADDTLLMAVRYQPPGAL